MFAYARVSVVETCRRFCREETGATAIEYGLIAAAISVAIVAVVFTIGTDLKTSFTTIKTCLETPSAAGCTGATSP